jgi:serine/threonine protein kinase
MNTMLKRRKRITELECKYYLPQIVSGLAYIHSQMVLHRDLKPANIFLDSAMCVKIADFGLSEKLRHDGRPIHRKTFCGTPNYMAPEVIRQQGGHTAKADIWAIGITLYSLLTGRPPFDSTSADATYRRILRSNGVVWPSHVGASAAVQDLVHELLRSDPTQRVTLSQLSAHRFLCSGTRPLELPATACQTCPVFDASGQPFNENGLNQPRFNQPMRKVDEKLLRNFLRPPGSFEAIASVHTDARSESRDSSSDGVNGTDADMPVEPREPLQPILHPQLEQAENLASARDSPASAAAAEQGWQPQPQVRVSAHRSGPELGQERLQSGPAKSTDTQMRKLPQTWKPARTQSNGGHQAPRAEPFPSTGDYPIASCHPSTTENSRPELARSKSNVLPSAPSSEASGAGRAGGAGGRPSTGGRPSPGSRSLIGAQVEHPRHRAWVGQQMEVGRMTGDRREQRPS